MPSTISRSRAAVTSRLRRQQFGGSIGGPIRRTRTSCSSPSSASAKDQPHSSIRPPYQRADAWLSRWERSQPAHHPHAVFRLALQRPPGPSHQRQEHLVRQLHQSEQQRPERSGRIPKRSDRAETSPPTSSSWRTSTLNSVIIADRGELVPPSAISTGTT